MSRLLRRHPFKVYGVTALVLLAIIRAFGLAYDDGGLGAILVLTSPFWGVVYWVPQEMLFTVNDGKAMEGHFFVSVVVGLAICSLADYLLARIRNRNGKMDKCA
jgi:hypothetical protein